MIFGRWNRHKRDALDAALQQQVAESESALDEATQLARRAKSVSQRLMDSRQANHYAERIRYAYEAEKRT